MICAGAFFLICSFFLSPVTGPAFRESRKPSFTPEDKKGEEEQKEETPEILSSYDLGYAGTLEGKTVIISLFADSQYLRWTREEEEKTLPVLASALSYLTEEAKKAGKEVSFIYDWREEEDLYHTARVFFPFDKEGKFIDYLDLRTQSWVKHKVSYDDLLAEYEADNILMIIYFPDEDRSYAVCYDGEDIPEETMIMFKNANAATYAHEMLHLFGAHDLYEDGGYPEEYLQYVKKTYPKEVMLTVKEKDLLKITKIISPITAYHIGWREDLPELEEYPLWER